MLQTALQAGLPLISGQTDDEVNIGAVLASLTKRTIAHIPPDLSPTKAIEKIQSVAVKDSDKYLFVVVQPRFVNTASVNDLYKQLTQANKTLLVVNPDKRYRTMFSVGTIAPPVRMVRKMLHSFVDEEQVEDLMPSCQGLSIKDLTEVCLLASAEYGEITRASVLEARRMYLQDLNGIEQVSTETDYYQQDSQLNAWLSKNRKFLLADNVPEPLRPRGLLLDGPPGTGKTLAAKVIARETGYPLYRLSLGGVLDKYVGESEANMEASLGSVSQAAPCVFLIDEVEKLFNGESDGVTSRLLSMLLWWLQEHRESVFTVMTTNKRKSLPEELYRPGRIDQTIELKGFTAPEAEAFVKGFLKQFNEFMGTGDDAKFAQQKIMKGIQPDKGASEVGHPRYNPATLRAAVIDYVKDVAGTI